MATSDYYFSPCCGVPIDVRRTVHDVVTYDAKDLDGDTLLVTFSKVYEGDTSPFEVTCSGCGSTLPYEVQED